jgi:hypothetical protein
MGTNPIYHQKAEILNFLMIYYGFAIYKRRAGELQIHKGQCSENWQKGETTSVDMHNDMN